MCVHRRTVERMQETAVNLRSDSGCGNWVLSDLGKREVGEIERTRGRGWETMREVIGSWR